MYDAPPWLRVILDKFEDLDFESKIRSIRRSPRKKAVLALLVLFVVYICWSSNSGEDSPSTVQQCVNDRLRHVSIQFDNLEAGMDHSAVKFVGNGHIGVDSSGELRFSSNGARSLDFVSGYFPFIGVDVEGSYETAESTITDFANGFVKTMKCFLIDSECACVERTFLAHRTRKHVIVQDIQIVNPTKTAINLQMSRPASSNEWQSEQTIGDLTVSTRAFARSSSTLFAAVTCSNAPGRVTIVPKREENYRFLCVAAQRDINREEVADRTTILKNLSTNVVSEYGDAKTKTGDALDAEHSDGWKKINQVTFRLSHSKAPGVLNGDRINATRYIIISNSKSPSLEIGTDAGLITALEAESRKSERCYTGHSTSLFPSRLWQDWDKPEQPSRIADLWLLTLEKRGCSSVMKTGAVGVAQAMVLSLMDFSFHDGHLELELPINEMHREMSASGITIGAGGATVSVNVAIDHDNRPFLEVAAQDTLYACDGGCLDEPVTLGKTITKLPVKVTKPVTSVLYVATSRKHLEQLRSAIHVSEVGSAPAHEDDIISLHRHGSRMGGLPTSLWVFLGVLLIAFHVFLAKLLWSEWKKGDMTPYNPYLRNRYSYSRSH